MVAPLVVAASLGFPALLPPITVSSGWGSVRAGVVSSCFSSATQGACADGIMPSANPATPVLRVSPGTALTIRPDAAFSSLSGDVSVDLEHTLASFKGSPPAPSRLTLPKRLPGVTYLTMPTLWRTTDAQGDGLFALKLVVPPTARPSRVRVTAARVTWTVTCPKDAGESCAGRSTLRTRGRIVARRSFAGLKAGARRTLSVAVGPEARRLLRADASVHAVVVRTDGHLPAVRTVQRLSETSR